jgi:predicted  nucleic acid-binding Zn-ribbon protein
MSTPITSILRECHRLRRFRRDLQSEIDLGPRVQKLQQAELDKQKEIHKTAYDTITQLKLKLKADEGTLKQVEGQLDNLHTRSLQVTTMREMDATRSEIAQANEKKSKLEDAILATMTEIEERTADLPNVEQRWKNAQAEFAKQQQEGKERLELLQRELKTAGEELEKQDASLPANVKSTYASLVKTHGPEGLAAVKDKVCRSCRTTLTAQKFIELQNGAFLTCQNCGKALYPE